MANFFTVALLIACIIAATGCNTFFPGHDLSDDRKGEEIEITALDSAAMAPYRDDWFKAFTPELVGGKLPKVEQKAEIILVEQGQATKDIFSAGADTAATLVVKAAEAGIKYTKDQLRKEAEKYVAQFGGQVAFDKFWVRSSVTLRVQLDKNRLAALKLTAEDFVVIVEKLYKRHYDKDEIAGFRQADSADSRLVLTRQLFDDYRKLYNMTITLADLPQHAITKIKLSLKSRDESVADVTDEKMTEALLAKGQWPVKYKDFIHKEDVVDAQWQPNYYGFAITRTTNRSREEKYPFAFQLVCGIAPSANGEEFRVTPLAMTTYTSKAKVAVKTIWNFYAGTEGKVKTSAAMEIVPVWKKSSDGEGPQKIVIPINTLPNVPLGEQLVTYDVAERETTKELKVKQAGAFVGPPISETVQKDARVWHSGSGYIGFAVTQEDDSRIREYLQKGVEAIEKNEDKALEKIEKRVKEFLEKQGDRKK